MYAIVTNIDEAQESEVIATTSGMLDEMKMEHIIKVFNKYTLEQLEKLIP